MEFSEFAQIFNKFLETGTESITQELVNAISDIDIENEINISPDGWRKYTSGSTNFKKIANKIKYRYEKQNFIDYLDDNFIGDTIPKLINEFKLKGISINKENWKEEISQIFVDIIDKSNGINTTIKEEDKSKDLDDSFKELDNKIVQSYSSDFNEADKKIKEAFNNSFSVANTIQSSKLNPELQKYYEVKYNHINGQSFGTLVPKNKEAIQKYPFNVLILPEEDSPEERERLTKYFNDMQKEANISNKSVKINEPLKFIERLGKYQNPFPVFSNYKNFELSPTPNLRSSKFTIRVYNKHYDLRFNSIEMWLLDFDKDHFVFSNIRDEKADYVLRVELSHTDKKSNTACIFRTKEEYIGDAKANRRNYLWRILLADYNTKLEIYSDIVGNYAIKADHVGKEKFTSKEYNEFKKSISYFDKIIFIEQQLDCHIDVDHMDMEKEMPAIDFLYYSIKRKSKTFRKKMYFDMEIEKKYMKGLNEGITLVNIESDLSFVELRGQTFTLNDTKVQIDKAEIIKIENLDDNTCKVYYQADEVKMIVK